MIQRFSTVPVTILEGHILFNHAPFYSVCHPKLRFFLTLDEAECQKRRALRVYDPPNPPGFFDQVVWPHYLLRLKEVQKLEGINYLDAGKTPLLDLYRRILGSITEQLESVLHRKTEQDGKEEEGRLGVEAKIRGKITERSKINLELAEPNLVATPS
jgi:hypothetical protein